MVLLQPSGDLLKFCAGGECGCVLDRTTHSLRRPWRTGVFPRPVAFATVFGQAVGIPGTSPTEHCVVVGRGLWDGFLDLSLWVEALSIHEWSLFTESVTQPSGFKIERGQVYTLPTERPGNRRPLDWGRNQADLLLLVGRVFECPWTGKSLRRPIDYDLDHLPPLSVYPTNELWNLAPTDRQFNEHVKRDRLPSHALLLTAAPRLELAYEHYIGSSVLGDALRQDGSRIYPRRKRS